MVSGVHQRVWLRKWFGSAVVRKRSLDAVLLQTTLLAGTSCGRRSLAGHEVFLARCRSHGAKQNVPPDKKASRLIPRPNIFSKFQTDEVVKVEGLRRIVATVRMMESVYFQYTRRDDSVDNKPTESELQFQAIRMIRWILCQVSVCVWSIIWVL